MPNGDKASAKPFLKWAGGKTQLLPAIKAALPKDLHAKPFTYVEPFVGSGAVFFSFLKSFPNISKAIINDVNKDLTETYLTIKQHPDGLVAELKKLERTFQSLDTTIKQKELYLQNRALFNARESSAITQSALMIFLNRTCFNGLYRVNANNGFNVPFGKYTNPKICDEENIYNVSAALQNVTILNGDYAAALAGVDADTFVYFDPPYKPLSQTASFNAYAKDVFDDGEQQRLKSLCDVLNKKGVSWLLSNSDPKNTDPENHFFENLYSDYHISRVRAKRMINSNASKRGEIYELLIHNYTVENAPALIWCGHSANVIIVVS